MPKRRISYISKLLPVLLVVFLLISCGGNNSKTGTSSQSSLNNDGQFSSCEVQFSHESGAIPDDSFKLKLSAPDGYEIYYTTDGSVPDQSSSKYHSPIHIQGSGNNWLTEETGSMLYLEDYYYLNTTPEIEDAWIIRAVAYTPDGEAGPVTTKTYLPGFSFHEEYGDVAIISIVTDPESLFDYEHGIMVKGKTYDDWISSEESAELIEKEEYYSYPANYQESGKEWEREVSFELFDCSESLTISANCGIRIHGGYSRGYPRRSFRVYFREQYGNECLNYPLFSDAVNEITGDQITEYYILTLRNGGNTAESLVYKDAWQQSLLKNQAYTIQEARPAILYLNGEYWGVYQLCERYDDEYYPTHFSVDHVISVKEGELATGEEEDMVYYDELSSFETQDLSMNENWNAFKQIMDIDSMADYFATQIFIANADFNPDKNVLLWRSVEINPENPYADGRWRFQLYDTEYASGLYGYPETSSENNTFNTLMNTYPLFSAAMKNEEFRQLFYSKLEELGTQNFAISHVNESLAEWDDSWNRWLSKLHLRFAGTADYDQLEFSRIQQFYDSRYSNLVKMGVIP